MKKNLFTVCLIAVVLIFGSSISFAASNNVIVNLNGSDSPKDYGAFISDDGHVYVSVDKFSSFYDVKPSWNPESKTLKLGDNFVGPENGMPTIKDGVLYAPLLSLVTSFGTGNTVIYWDGVSRTVNASVLPPGTVKLTPPVPQMGEHWADPKDMPLGPIYGVYNGKLIFIEIMPAKALDKTVHDIAGNKVPIPKNIDHFDIDWNPQGHEGFLVPHYDIHAYFISREEQNKIAMDGMHDMHK